MYVLRRHQTLPASMLLVFGDLEEIIHTTHACMLLLIVFGEGVQKLSYEYLYSAGDRR